METTKSLLVRAKLDTEEYAEIRKEAIDRHLHVGEYVARLIRKGRECLHAEEGTK